MAEEVGKRKGAGSDSLTNGMLSGFIGFGTRLRAMWQPQYRNAWQGIIISLACIVGLFLFPLLKAMVLLAIAGISGIAFVVVWRLARNNADMGFWIGPVTIVLTFSLWHLIPLVTLVVAVVSVVGLVGFFWLKGRSLVSSRKAQEQPTTSS